MKAVIFDLFGTLTYGRANPEAKIIESFNLDLSEALVEKFVCGTKFVDQKSYLREIVTGLGLEDIPATEEKISGILKQEIEKEKLKPGSEQILLSLKDQGYKLGLISNIPNPDYDIITRNNLRPYFDATIFSYEVGLLKPGKEIFELCLQELGSRPEEAVMVGDSLRSDIAGALGAGLGGILISSKESEEDKGYKVVSEIGESVEAIKEYFDKN